MLLLQTGPHCGASAARKVLQEPQQDAEPVMPRLSRFHKHASEADMEELLE